jgi:hypothetical protein
VTSNARVLGLVKFGAKEHIEGFAKGVVYMNTLQHFIEIEGSAVRKDSYEGMSHMVRGDGAVLQIEINGKFEPVVDLWGPMFIGNQKGRSANVFCMHAIQDDEEDLFIDPRNLEFGDSFALLLKPEEFLERIKTAAMRTEHDLQWRLVEYVDETSYEGPIGVFRKVRSFAYQREFRIALIPGQDQASKLNVGDLSDIVVLGHLSELNDRLAILTDGNGGRGASSRNGKKRTPRENEH